MSIVYADVKEIIKNENENRCFVRGMNQFGYGSKIETDYCVKLNNGSNRKYKVWCSCWSNCPSYYIIHNKRREYLNDTLFC